MGTVIMQQVSTLMLVVVAATHISMFPEPTFPTVCSKVSRSSNLAHAKLDRWSDQNLPSFLLRTLSLPKRQYSTRSALQCHLVHCVSLEEKN